MSVGSPDGWYFYNLPRSIDDERAFTANEFPARTVPSQYSAATLTRTISPNLQWWAFNPSDTRRLALARAENSQKPVAVGHERLLFEVPPDQPELRPIYWQIGATADVVRSRWVFSSSLTPIDPAWAALLNERWAELPPPEQYAAKLDKARQDPSLLRNLSVRLDVSQGDRKLSLDVLFGPDKRRAHLFNATGKPAGGNVVPPWASVQTVVALFEGRTPRGVCETVQEFDWIAWKVLRRLPDRPSDDPGYVPEPVNKLILVFHGIGQKLSASFNRLNFAFAIDKLRVLVAEQARQENVARHFKHSSKPLRFLVLAVNWRSGLAFDVEYSLDNITVQTLQPFRQAFRDVMFDIPLYMSPDHRPSMLISAAAEANRLYDKVVYHHPSFATEGTVHLVGHSLGSLITADMLTHQPTHYTGQKDAMLKFDTTNLFVTGSPLGFFLLMRKRYLEPRRRWVPSEEAPEPPFGSFAARNVYNLVHQSDMLGQLLNPTVYGDSGDGTAPPDTLPSARAMTSMTGDTKNGSRFNPISSIYRRWRTPPAEEEEQKETEKRHSHLLEVNDNGQLDWTFSSGSGPGNQYLKIFTSHFEYWSNVDVARFLAVECGREPGYTAPEHRAKWLQKSLQRAAADAEKKSAQDSLS